MGGKGGSGGKGQNEEIARQRLKMLENNPKTKGKYKLVRRKAGGWSVFPK